LSSEPGGRFLGFLSFWVPVVVWLWSGFPFIGLLGFLKQNTREEKQEKKERERETHNPSPKRVINQNFQDWQHLKRTLKAFKLLS